MSLPQFPRRRRLEPSYSLLQVKIPRILDERIRRAAGHQRRTVSAFVEEALSLAVDTVRQPKLPGT